MEEYISDVAGRVDENSTERPSDYYDEEGLLWCGVCKERKSLWLVKPILLQRQSLPMAM